MSAFPNLPTAFKITGEKPLLASSTMFPATFVAEMSHKTILIFGASRLCPQNLQTTWASFRRPSYTTVNVSRVISTYRSSPLGQSRSNHVCDPCKLNVALFQRSSRHVGFLYCYRLHSAFHVPVVEPLRVRSQNSGGINRIRLNHHQQNETIEIPQIGPPTLTRSLTPSATDRFSPCSILSRGVLSKPSTCVLSP